MSDEKKTFKEKADEIKESKRRMQRKIWWWIISVSSNFLQRYKYFNLNCITSDNIIYGLGGK